MTIAVSLHGDSRIGRGRAENQDRLLARVMHGQSFVLAIADGMGGVNAGGLAADTAIRMLETRIDNADVGPERLARIICQAGEEIIALAGTDEHLDGMGCTLTAVQVHDHRASWAHVGDTRLYHLSRDELVQISRDHRFLQDLIDAGDVTAQEALTHPLRNYLDQCVGAPDLRPDCGVFALAPGDLLMLTSDGLHDHIPPELMRRLLESTRGLHEIAVAMIAKAMDSGSTDDASMVLGRVNR